MKVIRQCLMLSLVLVLVNLPIGSPIVHAAAGGPIYPVQGTIPEEAFQTLLVGEALSALGYDLKPTRRVEYDEAYTMVANNKATFLAVNWSPLHKNKYLKAGGDETLYRKGYYVVGIGQGYMIDKKTADKYGITNLSQFKDAEIAGLFDTNADGKADLTGCNPDWGCRDVIEHHLNAYQINDKVIQNSENYGDLIEQAIKRYQSGQAIFYYAWMPYWASGELVPGKDVIWLKVPFTALPEVRGNVDTALPNGDNYGFEINSMRIVANKRFAEQNPAAAKLFEVMKLPISDISEQNMKMHLGEDSDEDIQKHVRQWIKDNQAVFDSWISRANAVVN